VPNPLPTGWPPVLISLDYATQQPPLPESVGDPVRYDAGQLRLVSTVPDGNQVNELPAGFSVEVELIAEV
jgi:hypothetical protein